MNRPEQNLDELFRDAFNGWEAPHTPDEIGADWSAFSAKLGAASSAGASAATGAKVAAGGKGIITAKLGALVAGAGLLLGGAAYYQLSESNGQISVAEPQVATVRPLPMNVNVVETDQNDKAEGAAETSVHGSVTSASNGSQFKNIKSSSHPIYKSVASAASNAPSWSAGAGEETSVMGRQTSGAGRQDVIVPAPETRNQVAGSQMPGSQLPETIALPEQTACPGEWVQAGEPGKLIAIGSDGGRVDFRQSAVAFDKAGRYLIDFVKNDDHQQHYEMQVNVLAKSEAHFAIKQTQGLKYTFANKSEGKVNGCIWDFGDGQKMTSAGNESVEHVFGDTGHYKVVLVARSGSCSDTSVQIVGVSNRSVDIPNIITPNGDGKNDALDIRIEGENYFDLTVMELNGAVVFKSKSKEQKWDGMDIRNGEFCSGTYYFILQYSFPGEKLQARSGTLEVRR